VDEEFRLELAEALVGQAESRDVAARLSPLSFAEGVELGEFHG
jgi:hypothetical protein